ncbi:uncharacterized protein BDZ99DRAFT_355545, partial [Mytilinidion resinicola]
KHYEIEGTLNEMPISAFPDTGAQKNVISLSYCRRLGLSIDKGSDLKFQLPSGGIVECIGSIRSRWKFANESKSTSLSFQVIADCTHDVILGGSFLKWSKTLTQFCHRIITRWRPMPQCRGVKLLGSQRQRVSGYLDGNFVEAIPDTGCDVMLMSRAYAEEHGYYVESGGDFRCELEFADGSRAYTEGMVTGLDWSYGDSETTSLCDFHILENLPADVVLSNDFLFEGQAFSKYEEFFYDI